MRYKVKSTAYTEDGERLVSVHRLVGSLESAELARERNIESIKRETQRNDIHIITRKEVI
jgi:hypothetical protein